MKAWAPPLFLPVVQFAKLPQSIPLVQPYLGVILAAPIPFALTGGPRTLNELRVAKANLLSAIGIPVSRFRRLKPTFHSALSPQSSRQVRKPNFAAFVNRPSIATLSQTSILNRIVN